MVEDKDIDALQQAASELLDEIQTDDFIEQLGEEIRALLDEIHAELNLAQTTVDPQSTADNSSADLPATSDDSRSG
jgi:hypothetical protein